MRNYKIIIQLISLLMIIIIVVPIEMKFRLRYKFLHGNNGIMSFIIVIVIGICGFIGEIVLVNNETLTPWFIILGIFSKLAIFIPVWLILLYYRNY